MKYGLPVEDFWTIGASGTEFCTKIPYFKKNKIKLLLHPKYFPK